MSDTTLYETDIVAWAEEQVEALRRLARSPMPMSNAVDWENVIEEIESLGKSQVYGVERKLTLVLVHLLKKLSAPDAPPVHLWRSEIVTFQIAAQQTYTSSMLGKIDWNKLWRAALKEAKASLVPYGDSLVRGLPASLPFSPEELLDEDFDVDAALLRLAQSVEKGDNSR